jgi:hypothetical protein
MMNAGREVGIQDKSASNYFSFWGLKVQHVPCPEPTIITCKNKKTKLN